MIYQAAVALPHDDRVVATDQLQRQLRVMAAAAGATPDWTTLAVTGPTDMPDAEAWTRFEWTASVTFRGGAFLGEVPDPDWLPSLSTAEDDTIPIRRWSPGESGQPAAAR